MSDTAKPKLTAKQIKEMIANRQQIKDWINNPPPRPPLTPAEVAYQNHLATAQAAIAQFDAILMPIFFKSPKGEGIQRENKYGASAVLDEKIERKIDEAALSDVLEKCPEGTEDLVIKWVPQLDLTAYRKLSTKTQNTFKQCLIATPKPSKFDIVPLADASDEEEQ